MAEDDASLPTCEERTPPIAALLSGRDREAHGKQTDTARGKPPMLRQDAEAGPWAGGAMGEVAALPV